MEVKIPKFVRLNNTAMRLSGTSYIRDNGHWMCGYVIKDGKLLSSFDRSISCISNVELVEITEEVWKKENAGYIWERYRGDFKDD